MTAAPHHDPGEDPTRLVAPLPSRVLVALDHFTPADRVAVAQAAAAFARGEAPATRLPDPEPLCLARATPELLILVRRATAGVPVVIEDILTQEAWDRVARAG